MDTRSQRETWALKLLWGSTHTSCIVQIYIFLVLYWNKGGKGWRICGRSGITVCVLIECHTLIKKIYIYFFFNCLQKFKSRQIFWRGNHRKKKTAADCAMQQKCWIVFPICPAWSYNLFESLPFCEFLLSKSHNSAQKVHYWVFTPSPTHLQTHLYDSITAILQLLWSFRNGIFLWYFSVASRQSCMSHARMVQVPQSSHNSVAFFFTNKGGGQ